MADRTLTVNGQPFTFNRDRFAGVRTMTVTGKPLDDNTTSIQVTVAGHSDISGIYTGTTVAGATWNQQGGNGTITAYSFNETDGYEYLLEDGSDSDPQYLLNNNAGFTDRPWKANLANAVTITPAPETVTVDRTASVIDSDRKGESRPLLSKLVGGAAAAYSLRDLNDRAGNNKVVEVRRSSDNEDRKFSAKEVSNGTLEAWVGAGNDGFVETWYDQSGENFHMLQAESTKQPKIVENGTFLGSVKYDGVDDYLSSGITAATMLDITNQAVSLFSVQTLVGSNDSTLGATNSGRGISFETSVIRVFITQNFHIVNHSVDGSGFHLGTVIHTGDGSSDQIKTALNGVNIEEATQSSHDIASDGQPIFTTKYNTLGGNRVLTTNSNFFNGEIKEVVIWKTNQLANRPAIEANINNQYDIY